MTTTNSNQEKEHHSDAYLIELEKQKTRRSRNMYLFFGTVIIAAIVALYFMVGSGGKGGIDVSLKEGTFKFNVDKPVVEQVKTETKAYETRDGKTIHYTTGKIDKQVLNHYNNENIAYSPRQFIGENLINEEAGYIISCTNPGTWTVEYNPAGLNDPLTPINTLKAMDGSHLNVTRESIQYASVQEYVNVAVSLLLNLGTIATYPEVSYADDQKTAFLTFTNTATNGQSFMKIIEGKAYYYIANANYNLSITDPAVQNELIGMVANFTLIE